jgi:uncharacterized protein YjbI with pentapeptide repeats
VEMVKLLKGYLSKFRDKGLNSKKRFSSKPSWLQKVPTWLFLTLVVIGLAGFAVGVNVKDLRCGDEPQKVGCKKTSKKNDWLPHSLLLQAIAKLIFDNAESIAIVSAVALYFKEAPDRETQSQYEAWQVIDRAAAAGVSTSYARIKALEDLNNAGISLQGIDMPGADLRQIDLSGADLKISTLNRTDLIQANLSGANLTRVNFGGSNLIDANLNGADLSDANLNDANLMGADLSGVELKGTVLYLANLSLANLRGVKLNAANFSSADLRGADLSGADLTELSFDPLTLYANPTKKTRLSMRQGLRLAFNLAKTDWVDFDRVDFGSVKFSDADLSGANLSGANLSGANLSGANLSGANLSGANLSGANLSGANLSGANLSRTTLTNCQFLNTTMPDGTILNPSPPTDTDQSSM